MLYRKEICLFLYITPSRIFRKYFYFEYEALEKIKRVLYFVNIVVETFIGFPCSCTLCLSIFSGIHDLFVFYFIKIILA
jgi:hypothetical protein